MTKWQLPQGVEYPIDISTLEADYTWSVRTTNYKRSEHIQKDYSLNWLILQSQDTNAHSIRINNSIDLVKIEE